jgi:uncharacterized pyridoxamine 5'-phosphate oxidase family protein
LPARHSNNKDVPFGSAAIRSAPAFKNIFTTPTNSIMAVVFAAAALLQRHKRFIKGKTVDKRR